MTDVLSMGDLTAGLGPWRELDFSKAYAPHPEARNYVERGWIDCPRCLPGVHKIEGMSSGECEGEPWTILQLRCGGRMVVLVFDDYGQEDDGLDPNEDGLS